MTIQLVLVLLAFVCTLLAAIGVPSSRIALGWLGLTFYFLSLLIH
jgi:hypothetical protein